MKRLLPLGLVFLWLTLPAPAKALLLPLDDRPANFLMARQIARIGGQELVTPSRHLLGQFHQPGDTAKLAAWIKAQAQPGDTVFLSSEMLIYGGLVASRKAEASLVEALERLELITDLAQKGVRLRVLAILPRLSLYTSERQAPYERDLAAWAKNPGAPPPSQIPEPVVEEYLAVRRRNHDVLLKLVQLANQGLLEQLVIGQDDSHSSGLHLQEQALLLEASERNTILLSGADELTMVMVAGWLVADEGPTVRVTYSDPEAASTIPPLESLPLSQMVEQHLELSGARLADPGELELFVYCPADQAYQQELKRERARPFVAKIKTALTKGKRVAVADLALVNRMDPGLAQEMLAHLDLTRLEGLAGWNTPANALGTVVAQMIAHRYARRTRFGRAERLESELTHQAFLLARLIDDYGYQTYLRSDLGPAVEGFPSRPDPLRNLYGPVGLEARRELVDFGNRLFEQHFRNRSVDLSPYPEQVTLGRVSLEVVLPWPRLFEVEVRVDLRK